MPKAVWNGVALAESDKIAHVEGNAYFPNKTVNWDHVVRNEDVPDTFCHWKGFASYFDVVVAGEENQGAAWHYETPYDEASLIKDHIAFWKGVEIIDGPEGRGLVEAIPSQRGDKSGWEALCWLIRHSEKSTLNAQDIIENTDITEETFDDAWQMPDVQRYAMRYRWTIESRSPLVLQKSEGDPVDVN
ncbi:MAG: hypothetical protein CMM52_11375 [Rhodospirillaceae bacterium]|nr:hypothetical protein [Rhodospirillaceae bacterium]|tara:strand:- start:1437 stop:2000 length:564 start_codon:yes stop_codon:yes gene_type:complete